MTVSSYFCQVFFLSECQQEMLGDHYSTSMWAHTHTSYPTALFNTITRICHLWSTSSQNAKLCKKKSVLQHIQICMLYCTLLVKSRQSCHHFFLPQVYEFMENARKCRLTIQLCYKTTLSSQVVAIPGLLLWEEICVICCRLLAEHCLLRLHKNRVCESSPPSEDRWEVCVVCLCVGLGGANSSGL